MFTGALGTAQSQPGKVQPGYFCTGVAVWRGPFPGFVTNLSRSVTVGGSGIPVAPAVASALAAADISWWEMH